MNFNANFGKKPAASAADAARRERERRQQQRQAGDAGQTIAKAWRRHRAVSQQMQALRAEFDTEFARLFPPAALKALKLTPASCPLPPARTTLRLVLLTLRFRRRKPRAQGDGDDSRFVNLSRVVSTSIARPPDQNYCFLLNDPAVYPVWERATRRLCDAAVSAVATYSAGQQLPRIDCAAVLKLLIDLMQSRNWGYLRVQGKAPADYTQAERELLARLTAQAQAVCASFQRHLAAPPAFQAVHAFLTGHCPMAQQPPEKEDILVSAVLQFALRLSEGGGGALYAHSVLEVPALSARIARSQFRLLHARALWEAALEAVARDPPGGQRIVPAPPGDWPERHRAANVIEIGRNVLQLEGVGAASHELAQRWVFAVNALLSRMPPWPQTRKLLETEGWLERQLSLLWDPSTVVLLFRELFPKEGDGDEGDAAAVHFTPTTEQQPVKKKEKGPRAFFARLRDKARRKEVRAPSAAASPHPEAQTPEARGLLLESIVSAWRPPVWLTSCRLFNTLIHAWSSRAILAALSTRPYMVVALWGWVDRHMAVIDAIAEGTPALPPHILDASASVLLLFLHCYDNFLPVCDDREFYELEQPFPLARVAFLVDLLCRLAFRLTWHEHHLQGAQNRSAELLRRLRGVARSTLVKLSDRNTRRAFCPTETWLIEPFRRKLGFLFRPGDMDDQELQRYQGVVHELPFMITFEDRSIYLRRLVDRDRATHRVADIKYAVTIRREYLLEDGLDQFRKLAADAGSGRLKARLHVQFKNREGLEEAGIDAGGVFKEFIERLVQRGFDPDLGLFRQTTENKLYPNPDSALIFPGHQHNELFTFLGRVLAKAVYEGMTVNLPFADFFLNILLGRSNFVDDLRSLDPDLHKNLMLLKELDDVEDMCLTFCVTQQRLGETVTVDLIPNGSEVEVTNDNLLSYMKLLANYKLSQQFRNQAQAFLAGFHEVLPPRWVNLFSRTELQQLISGLDGGVWEVSDLRKHTKYSGGYGEGHQVIKDFWRCLEEFSPTEKGRFLQFVTSSSKPPLLGFAHLHPPFCIRTGGDDGRSMFGDTDRLPSASTCFNLLKLPPYKSRKNMKEKLLYAINSNAGFELS